MIRMLGNEVAVFLLALQFLTRLPVPTGRIFSEERLAAAPRYFPLIGALVGGVAAGVWWGAALVFPPLIAVLLSTGATLLLTGAFHEDGLADTFDGIGGGMTPARSLEIMKDSRIGTYGACALITALALKVSVLVSLPTTVILCALVAGHALSRVSAVVTIATSRYVRFEGKAKPVASGLSFPALMLTLLTGGGVIALLFFCAGWAPALIGAGLVGLALGHVVMRLFFEPKLGGYTGDALGAVQQASELGFYMGLLAWL